MDKETKEKLEAALDRQEPVFFTPLEIERIWELAIKEPVLEMEKINLIENSAYLDALKLNCYKSIKKGIQGAESNLEKIEQIEAFNSRAITGLAIREFQSIIIRELRIKMLKMERKIREQSEIINVI